MSNHEELANWVRMEAGRVMHRTTRRSAAIVDGYDPKTHAVKVRLMPDSVDKNNPVVTGWLQLATQQSGSNFGWHLPPNIGDPGWVEFHDNDREAGQFASASFNDKFPPVEVKAGEWLYKNKWGALINFKEDGSTAITDKGGTTITFDGQGNATVSNTAGASVLLKKNGNLAVSVNADKILYLGGDGEAGSYAFVSTVSGPSINVKARIG